MTEKTSSLALHGGMPALRSPLPPMYPGGMRIAEEEETAVLEALRARRLFRYYGPNPGPSKVAELEEAFAAHVVSRHALAVTSGTAALLCALAGLGIGPGDEVIIPAYTWIATASAVVHLGAVPVLAEIDDSLTLDPLDVEARITAFTKAVIPVHMRGLPCKMDELLQVARKNGLKVLEDTAQADGASYRGEKLGGLGDVGAFSLQFNKIITSGEGGMVVTDDDQIFERAVMYHDVIGGQRNNIPEERILPGVNFRMPELLAAVASVQLKRLDGLLEAMRARKRMLQESLSRLAERKGVRFPVINDPSGEAALCLIFLLPQASQAQQVSQALKAEGLGNWLLYHPEVVDYHVYTHWSPIMHQRTWSPFADPWKSHPRLVTYEPGMCPRTLDLLGRAVHIDVSPELTNSNIEEMCEAVEKVFNALL